MMACDVPAIGYSLYVNDDGIDEGFADACISHPNCDVETAGVCAAADKTKYLECTVR